MATKEKKKKKIEVKGHFGQWNKQIGLDKKKRIFFYMIFNEKNL